MSGRHLKTYLDRMRRALDFIDAHGDEPIEVAVLANVAAFSPFHFQRQFTALFGVSVGEYQRQMRLRRAASRLAFDRVGSVTEIALEAGYGGGEAFARAFRALLDQSPAAFRKHPDWEALTLLATRIDQLRRTFMPDTPSAQSVEVVSLPSIRLLTMTHNGSPALIGETVRRFIAFRRAAHLRPTRHATFNLFPADPALTPSDQFHMLLGVETSRPLLPEDEGIGEWTIPAMRCARIIQTGGPDDLGPAFNCLYGEWLPASGEQMRDHPPFARRVSFYPDVPLHEAVTELYLPLA
jgi:AraC family transcriptional regulator